MVSAALPVPTISPSNRQAPYYQQYVQTVILNRDKTWLYLDEMSMNLAVCILCIPASCQSRHFYGTLIAVNTFLRRDHKIECCWTSFVFGSPSLTGSKSCSLQIALIVPSFLMQNSGAPKVATLVIANVVQTRVRCVLCKKKTKLS